MTSNSKSAHSSGHASSKNVLSEPWVEAVRNFDSYTDEQLIKAHAEATSRAVGHPVTAAEILNILEQWSSPLHRFQTGAQSSLDCRKYGSDGESDSEYHSLDSQDAGPDSLKCDNDLNTDGECLLSPAHPKQQQDHHKQENGIPSTGTDNKDIKHLKLKFEALKSENRLLKEKNTCRKCHIQQVSVTFLPCGHYSYCYDCGQTFSSCPICKKTILADVKTYLA